MMTTVSVKRALLSVSNKQNIVDFAQKLIDLGVEIVSTGGTSEALKKAGIPFLPIEQLTELPEMLNGRVKTLHPKVHGGILGRRDLDKKEAEEKGISWIDLVVVNFYPFTQAIGEDHEKAIEYIDIGGPTMVRAAAKNCAWVGVVVDPNDYETVADELTANAGLSWQTRKTLAAKAFTLTCSYDGHIRDYFTCRAEAARRRRTDDDELQLQTLTKHAALRYGENPHQKAVAYRVKGNKTGLLSAIQHQGKPLSYNNIVDAEAAVNCVAAFDAPSCVIVKHANPCGVAIAPTIELAYENAHKADPVSAFGGIVAINQTCTKALVDSLLKVFTEVLVAPAYTDEALALLSTKPNLRVLQMSTENQDQWEMKYITGGLLLQEKDKHELTLADLRIVTEKKPTTEAMQTMLFAWRVIKHVKSNAIVIARQNATIGIGAGQVSRIDAVSIAMQKAIHTQPTKKLTGCVLASDAFFPFRDNIDRLANTGIEAIIQPGGSVKDNEVIAACNEHGIAMVFTGVRCFKH